MWDETAYDFWRAVTGFWFFLAKWELFQLHLKKNTQQNKTLGKNNNNNKTQPQNTPRKTKSLGAT